MSKASFYTDLYIKRAIELGLIPKYQYAKAYKELDPDRLIESIKIKPHSDKEVFPLLV